MYALAVSERARISPHPPARRDFQEAADLLRRGDVVVFPTETVYGLGADARSDRACREIFARKGRPADNPLIVHVPRLEAARPLTERIPPLAARLFEAFAPGPLSIVLPAGPAVSPVATAGSPSVAIRIPSHPIARELLEHSGVPIAAPSANRSGRPSPTSAAMAFRDMGDRVDLILDGGPCVHGVESTVLAVGEEAVTVLREGAVTREMLRELPGTELILRDPSGAILDRSPSPGTRHAHYRPRARVRVLEREELEEVLRPGGEEAGAAAGAEVGRSILLYRGLPELSSSREDAVQRVLRMPDPASYAQGLFQFLFEADERGDAEVIAELPPAEGIGRAIRDRLLRAAGADQ